MNNKLNDFIEKYPLTIDDLHCIDNLSNMICEELDNFNKYIQKDSNQDNNNNQNQIEFKQEEEIIPDNAKPNEEILNNNELKKNEYKNEINLTYIDKNKGTYNIFGQKFVKNNIDKIELIINGKHNKLVSKYQLVKSENNVKIIIKNKLTNLSYIFSLCKI